MIRAQWHPRDPIDASRSAVERVRAALRRYDPCLNVWWSPNRGHQTGHAGRWRVVRWAESAGEWHTLFYWEGAQREYRPLLVEPLLYQLRYDEMLGRQGFRRLDASLEEVQAQAIAKRRAALQQLLMDRAKEVGDVLVRGKQTFAPGYIRKRNFGSSMRPGGWAQALVHPELYDKLDDFDKAVVDHMRTSGYEP